MSDLDKLITACHHFFFSLSPSASVDPSVPSLSLLFHLFPLHPSLRHLQHVTTFISSISVSTFPPSKMLLSNLSRGFRHPNSTFGFQCRFSISHHSLHFLFFSCSLSFLCSSPLSYLSHCYDSVFLLYNL